MAKRSIADSDCKQAKVASLSPVLKLQLALSTTIWPFSVWINSVSGLRASPPTNAPLWAIALKKRQSYIYFQHKMKINPSVTPPNPASFFIYVFICVLLFNIRAYLIVFFGRKKAYSLSINLPVCMSYNFLSSLL